MPQRHVFRVPLSPIAGERFQPTGFPDLGAAKFQKYDRQKDLWIDSILVESEQSMANHLEGAGWDDAANAPKSELASLPYVRVVNASGEYLTSSRTEAHRLSSAFIREAKGPDGVDMVAYLSKELDLTEDKPLSARHIAHTVFSLDPCSLIHGVFFADPKLLGQPKITRALTGFIEAIDVRPAEYGGVKKDDVTHKNTEGQGSGEGYGSIPFHRTMWTARDIVASFVLDLDQLRSYALSEDATRLLEVLALWEVRTLLDGGLRLRTMCDLAPLDDTITGLPAASTLSDELQTLATELAPQLGNGAPMTVIWGGAAKKKGAPKQEDE